LSAVYEGYLLYADQYTEDETQYLKNQLNSIIRKVTFDQAAANLSDMSDFGEQDPHEVFVAFSEGLVSAAEACVIPVGDCLRRGVGFIGGLRSKIVFRAVAVKLTAFVKALSSRIDELRIACAVPPDSQLGTADRLGIDEPSATTAESWARKLDSCDISGKSFLQCALRSLQASGRMIKRVKDLESLAMNSLASLLGSLFRDQSLERAVLIAVTNSGGVCVQYGAFVLQQDFTTSSELRSFLTASTSLKATHTIFGSVIAPLSRLKVVSGSLLFDLCSAVPEKVLNGLYAEDVWNSPMVGDTDNLLPQSFFTQVKSIYYF
jgi:hypothetical protein